MRFDKVVEDKIREAMANGEFDNLAGRGKPLNLDDYFSTPEDLRATYSVLKTAGVLPPEVTVLREIESLKDDLGRTTNEHERAGIRKSINNKVLGYNLMMEHYRVKRFHAK
ncbi:MAG TPA: DUF1992 domain-containing protein [Blastocatellia bacterium]|nr:DUF1992 domain-containing protein [Blastocatellia bacterium]